MQKRLSTFDTSQIPANETHFSSPAPECYDKDEFRKTIEDYLYPTHYEFVMIAMHIIVFIVGLIGNTLVCISVYRNHSMRNVVNYFIVNLAGEFGRQVEC